MNSIARRIAAIEVGSAFLLNLIFESEFGELGAQWNCLPGLIGIHWDSSRPP